MDGAGTQAAFSHPSPSIARLANHHSWRPVHVCRRVDGKATVAAQPSTEEERIKALQVCVCVSLSRSLALSSSHPTQGFGVGDNTHLYVMYMDCSCNTAIFTFFFLFGDVQALLSCPTSSIHTEEPPKDILQVQNMFPLPIDDKLLPVCMFVMFRAFISADTILKTHLGQHRTW
jgi:hypothetical protein